MWARTTAVLLLIAVAGCGGTSSGPTVEVGGAKVRADVAETPQELQTGLSGRAPLDPDEGMLFELPGTSRQPFWMKEMRFPIDIVWIAKSQVVDVSARLPAPRPGTPDSELPLYRPRHSVDSALEVSAGWASRNGIARGDTVTVER